MTQAQAFNEWMRRYIEEPDRFYREWQVVEKFKSEGDAPTYGDRAAAYMAQLMAEKPA